MSELTAAPGSSPCRLRHRARWPGIVAGLLALAFIALGCGGDVESRMAEVRALQDVGQFTASIDELRQILAIDPDNPEATYRLGVALVQTGEPSRAVWALEKASESPEYAIPASLLLSSAHFSANNFEASIRAADRVLELDPNRHAALRMRARANIGAVRLEEALADTQRLLERFPDDYEVWALNATVLSDLGRIEEARAAHDKLKELALAGGDPAVAHRGCIAPALFARDQQEMERAEELYDDCVERFPTKGFVINEATRFYDQIGKREKATEMIRRAVEESPDNLSLHSTLANRLRASGDVEGAEKVLVDAAKRFQSAGAWNLLASFYRDQQQHEKALEALEEVAKLSGGGTDPMRFARADVLIDTGQYDRAEEIAASLSEPTYARLLRGRIALEQGDPGAALELLEQGIRVWPGNPGARYLAGRAAYELGDLDRAVSELREAMRVDSQGAAAAELLARIHFERGEYQEALRVGRAATVRRGSHTPENLMIGARSFTELGMYDNARETLAVLKKHPGQEVRAAVELARVERAAGGPSAALEAIEASGLDTSDAANFELLRSQADNLLAAGQADLALAKLDTALAKSPDAAALYEMRGQVLTRLARDEEARAALEKSVELDPQHAQGYAGLATLEARSNNLARAVELFDRAAELSPQTSTYAYSAAQLALASGDSEGGEKRLREIVRRFPSHAGARNDLAWILAEKGEDLDQALELAEEANRLDPSPEMLDTLGWVRLQRGEWSAAVAVLEQAVEAEDSPSMRYRLGLALRHAGDAGRAREMLQSAIDSGSFPEAADARRELAQLEP